MSEEGGSKSKNGDNLNSVRHETSKPFKKKKGEYLKDIHNKVGTDGSNKNVRVLFRGINEFRRGYQSRINLVKDE